MQDWFSWAPPKMGERQWKDGRSAKELARSWFRKGFACPPDEIRQLLEEAFRTEIAFDEARPECIIELDDFRGEHRNCDLVVLCKAGMQPIAINIEAKADEPFGDTIGSIMTRRSSRNRMRQHEFGSYHWHCLDDSQMKRFADSGISFSTRQPPL